MNADNITIVEYMNKYDSNTYFLSIKDEQKLNEMKDILEIDFEETINNDTFEKYEYDVLILALLNEETLSVQSVLPYKNKLTIVLTKKSAGEKKKAFCVFVPKLYNNENIEIVYEEEKTEIEPPKDAVHFKFSEFYVEKIEKFDELKLKYDNEKEVYYTEFLDPNSYYDLIAELGIVTENNLSKDLSGKEVVLIFKKTNNKLDFRKLSKNDGILQINLIETEEEYGVGITGVLMIFDEGIFDEYKAVLTK